tara:strand:+ start:867 stop:2267 length:1401 start_codon:yes stop_codon:yes gene_type:complete
MFETWLGFIKFKNKAMRKYIKTSEILLFVFILAISNPILAQEYDDMYFTKADRKQTDFNLKVNHRDADRAISAFEDDDLEEVYLDKNVNPEYIAKYQVQPSINSSIRNQEVEYYPEANTTNLPSKIGFFNNYGRQVTPHQTATFGINPGYAFGSKAYNSLMYGYDQFGNVWINDLYSPNGYNFHSPLSYGYPSVDPWSQVYGGSWVASLGRNPMYHSSYYSIPGWAMMRTPYPTGWGWNTGVTEGPKGIRSRVLGPRGSSGSKTVIRGAVVDGSPSSSNRSFRTTSALSNSKVRDLGNQNSQNEYLNQSVNQRGTNQSFNKSNSVEALSRNQSVRNSISMNQRKITKNNQRSYMAANNRAVTTKNKSARRYYSTSMPERNDFNMSIKGDIRNTYQNRGAQYSSGSSSGVTTNSSSTNATSRSYKSSYNSYSGSSRNYSAPSSSGNRSSISSSGSRSSGGSSRSIKH